MVHSIEMLLDTDTESAVRRVWAELAEAGLRALSPTHRPHVTASVADRIAPEVDEQLRSVSERFPFRCVVGAPMLFGRSPFTLVRLVVPTPELLATQAEIHRLSLSYLNPGPADNTLPGRWTPHVTLARRVDISQLSRVLTNRRVSRELAGHVVGLRRWDGNQRVEHVID
jgi:hypothetical protein